MSETQGWIDRFWTSREGLRLHFRDYVGDARRVPVLCLHGLTRNARDFEELAPRLAGERRVIVPDFRGRGLSDADPVPQRYVPPVYAGDVLQLLDELGIAQAIFIGTSLGGLVTMAVAAFAPQRIAGTVLNDVGPELDPRGLERIRGYVGRPAAFANWPDAAAALKQGNAAVYPHYSMADWERFARRLCRESDGAVVFDYDMAIGAAAQGPEAAPSVDGWPFFRALSHAPLLVLRGELSDLLAPKVAAAMVAEHPDAELVTVPSVGHAPDLSEPQASAAIDRLLRRADAD